MKRFLVVLIAFAMVLSFAGVSQAITLNQVADQGDSDGQSDEWSFICQLGEYEAFFGFDLSSIPDDTVIYSMTFTATIYNYESSSDRTLWYSTDDSWFLGGMPVASGGLDSASSAAPAPVMVGSVTQTSVGVYEPFTFNIDLSLFDWTADLADNFLTLFLSGPADGSHICGQVLLMESGTLAELDINNVVPIPGAVWLLGSGLLGLAGFRRKFIN